MVKLLLLGLIIWLLTLRAVAKLWTWKKHYRIAKTSSFPVFLSPVHITDAWWAILYPVLLPLLRVLPRGIKEPWFSFCQLWNIWKAGHSPFADVGSDSLILATPNGNMLWTCDYAVINQILTQSKKAQIPTAFAKFWDVWGPTVASVEGDEWKGHRRAIEIGLNGSINPAVWRESQRQSQIMIDLLMAEDQSTTLRIMDWTSKLAFHVIAHASFGMKMKWERTTSFAEHLQRNTRLPFDEALKCLVQHIGTVFMLPRALLHRIPFGKFREVSASLVETERYIHSLQTDAERNMETLLGKRPKSILEAIVASGYSLDVAGNTSVSKRSVTGDLFFTLLAGYETVGTVMGFILIFCAIYPDVQKRIAEQLDKQLGDRPPESWTVEHDFAALNKGYIGAVQMEVMSLYQPASFIWRQTVSDVTVTDSRGVLQFIPSRTLTLCNTSGANKNPVIWHRPNVSPSYSASTNDSPALYFDPDRWLGADGNLRYVDEGTRTSKATPNWMGFGLGPRSCPGKAFAQVQMAASLATLLKNHALELVVQKQTLSAADHDENLAWQMTQALAIQMMKDDIKANINIALDRDLPIRIVRR